MLNRSNRFLPLSGTSIKKFITDTTGTVDQRDQFSAALVDSALNGYTLVIDTPVKIDATNGREVYIPDGARIFFTGSGRINGYWLTNPLFVALHSNFEIVNLDILYQGPGIDASVDYGSSPGNAGGVSFINRITNLLTTQYGNTFVGGAGAIWYGPHHMMSAICLYGKTSGFLKGETKFRVSTTATADKFIPWAIASKGQWTPGVTNITGTGDLTLPNQYVSIPSLYIDDLSMDGVLMGVQGEFTTCEIQRTRSYRYSDVMSSTGTLIGGVNNNFPPPHLFYLDGRTDLANISDVIDYGTWTTTYADSTVRRSSTSGYCCSLKYGSQRGNVSDYKCYRPDGLSDFIGDVMAFGKSSYTFENFYAEYNSAISNYPCIRFPSTNYLGTVIKNGKLVDNNPSPIFMPLGSNTDSNNRRVVITDVECEVNDFTGTDYPGCYFNGSRNVIDVKYILRNHTQTQTYRGVLCYQGVTNTTVANTSHKVDVIGWRNFSTDVNGLRNRLIMNGGTSSTNPNNNHAEVNDITNGHSIKQVNGTKSESWTQRVLVTPTAGSTSVATSIKIPANWFATEVACGPRVALGTTGGLTGFTIGWANSVDTMGTVTGTSTSSRIYLKDLPIAAITSDRQILLTATGGTFDGTGTIELIVTVNYLTIGE